MYLVSIYFDEQTNKKLTHYIRKIAEKTGNKFMIDNQVSPHLTVSSVEARCGEPLISCLQAIQDNISKGAIQIVSVGMLFPYVIYVTPVLNQYLQELSQQIYEVVNDLPEVSINRFYQPMQWLPHITLGKKLTREEMRIAFEIMQEDFVPIEATITKIGIARTNPHEDIWELSL